MSQKENSSCARPKNSPLWFTFHFFLATFGVAFLAAYLTGYVFDLLYLIGRPQMGNELYVAITGTPYFPIQTAVGLTLGWIVGRKFSHPVMHWMWVIPLSWLTYAVIALPTLFPSIVPPELQAGVGQSRLFHYLGWGCLPQNRCLDQPFTTMPFIARPILLGLSRRTSC